MARIPNFLFIGPDKTGSSWMYEILARHPECYVPLAKDIYFFDRYYSRGFDWYLRFFRNAPNSARAVGELSHDYFVSPAAAMRIHGDLPHIRLLTCLRNPVKRTYSHYLYLVRSGLTKAPFEQALEEFPELVDHSLYAKHLSVYLDLFDRRAVKVMLFDSLEQDPQRFAAEMFRFLDLPFIEGLPYREKVRSASAPRSHALALLAKRGALLTRDLGLAGLVGTVKRSAVAGLIYRPIPHSAQTVMGPVVRQRLLSIFDTDLRALERLLGPEVGDVISHWRA